MFLWVFYLDITGNLGEIVTQRDVGTNLFVENTTENTFNTGLGSECAVVLFHLIKKSLSELEVVNLLVPDWPSEHQTTAANGAA